MQDWSDRILYRTGGLNMDKNYIIETKNLTKQYGSQKSVADLNIHVQRGRIYGLLGRKGEPSYGHYRSKMCIRDRLYADIE